MPNWTHQSACLQNIKEKILIKAFKLKGSSMYPLYKEGETILCRTDFDSFKRKAGDFAVYEIFGSFYLHKIKRKTDKGFYFDNFDDLPEHFVYFSQVKAVPILRKNIFFLYCVFLAFLRKILGLLK